MTTMPKILLVDDDPVLLENVEMYLETKGFHTATAVDGVDALAQLDADPPDLMVLDMDMPRMRGLGVLREMKIRGNKTPVIVMTKLGRDNELDTTAHGLGAVSYLDKPFRGGLLEAQIKSIWALIKPLSDETECENVTLRIDHLARQVYWNDESVHLAPKEFDLLEFLMRHPRQHFTRSHILAQVWDEFFEEGTVTRHIACLRQKIEILREIIEGTAGGYIFKEKVVQR